MFAYLEIHNRSSMVFNDKAPVIDETLFREADCEEFECARIKFEKLRLHLFGLHTMQARRTLLI